MILERGIVHVPKHPEGVDKDVPEYGNPRAKLRPPAERPLQKDAFGTEARVRRRDNGIARALHFGHGIGELPPVPFPHAEHFQHVPFTEDDWQQKGNMEASYARMRKMFEYPTRHLPAAYAEPAQRALRHTNVLDGVRDQAPVMDMLSREVYDHALEQMSGQRQLQEFDKPNGRRGAYQAPPVFYAVSPEAGRAGMELWKRGLAQAAGEFAKGRYNHVRELVELHGRTKDPVTPNKAVWDKQAAILEEMDKEARKHAPKSADPAANQIMVAQLVQEASGLAVPDADNVFYLGFGGHQELPYIPVRVKNMPRGEFANAERTHAVMKGMIRDAKELGLPAVTPITVAHVQEPHKNRPDRIILDGNNRSTAKLLMEYMNEVGDNRTAFFNPRRLHKFIEDHELDVEWERDLKVAIAAMSSDHFDELMLDADIIASFAHADMPALLTQEADYHTIAVQLSQGQKITLLQPMHQALYHQLNYPMAILSKMQTHGRSIYNDRRVAMLPQEGRKIIPFTGRREMQRAA